MISWSQLNSQPDILDQIGGVIDFGVVPGSSDSMPLTLNCTTCPIPGGSQEMFEATSHGHTLRFPGRRVYSGSFAPTFNEIRNFGVGAILQNWLELVRGGESSAASGYKRDLAVDAVAIILDSTKTIVRRCFIQNVIIQELPDTNMDGSSSAAIQHSPTFQFDRVDWLEGALL